eukprot:6670105-Heterocapsa_arctica.AAC.1
MPGDQVAEIQMRGSVLLNSGGEKRLAVPGRTFKLTSKRGARGAIKGVGRFRRGRTRRQMME